MKKVSRAVGLRLATTYWQSQHKRYNCLNRQTINARTARIKHENTNSDLWIPGTGNHSEYG